jgi:thymidine phosphorylase
VGFDRIVKVGEPVAAGDVIARVHAHRLADAGEAEKKFLSGFLCE